MIFQGFAKRFSDPTPPGHPPSLSPTLALNEAWTLIKN